MVNFSEMYNEKLVLPTQAVESIPRKANISFGLGPSNPPALLSALAQRIAAKDLDDISLYYQLADEGARPLFKIEFLDRLSFHPNFLSSVDRALIKEAGTNSVIDFMPCYLWQLPRIYTDFNHMNVFMTTVSPMDRHGYFSLGTSCDYSSTVARDCDMLMVEVNNCMPRVFGQNLIHISEVDSIVEKMAHCLNWKIRRLPSRTE